jgi:DNA-binding MarR family transcriptional regulator
MRIDAERAPSRGNQRKTEEAERGAELFAELERRLLRLAMGGALPLTRYLALSCLERGPRPIAAFGAALGIAPSTTSELATRMQEDGLITRSRGSNARLVQLGLTAEGEAALRRCRAAAREQHRALVADRPEEEREAVVAAVQLLVRLLPESPRRR